MNMRERAVELLKATHQLARERDEARRVARVLGLYLSVYYQSSEKTGLNEALQTALAYPEHPEPKCAACGERRSDHRPLNAEECSQHDFDPEPQPQEE